MNNPIFFSSCRYRLFLPLAVLAWVALGQNSAQAQPSADQTGPGLVVRDTSGILLQPRGIALVDWDGYLANPAVKLTFTPPAEIKRFPAKVTLSISEPRMYFDLPSKIGANGPSKTITFRNASSKVVVYLSIFPDRAGKDEDQLLKYSVIDADSRELNGSINIHVFDQDENRSSPFKATVDFAFDVAGLFKDPVKRQIVQLAADDWAYFIDGMELDSVSAGREKIAIFPPITDFSKSNLQSNPMTYTGFLLELYGVDDPEHRAGGEGSTDSFQSSHGKPLPLRRSGNVAVETKGNWNILGWLSITKDSDWWMTDNRGEHVNDLYSIVHHEMGHALGFNPNYPLEKAAKDRGDFESPELLSYHGKYPKVDNVDHLGGEIDDASRRAAFGNEYNAKMPEGRWLITKLDILCLETIGYKIRRTFDLTVQTNQLLPGHLHAAYTATLKAKGGLPWYAWTVESGALPDGLTLNPDTGIISGQPTLGGTFKFTIRLTDSSVEKTSVVSAPLTISIQ